jgi:hypothetical protein
VIVTSPRCEEFTAPETVWYENHIKSD